MKTHFQVTHHQHDDVFTFSGAVCKYDIVQLDLTPLDRALMSQPNDINDPLYSANTLLVLEMLFRRMAEQNNQKETPDLAVSEGEHVARVVGEKSVKYLTNEEVNMQDTNIRLVMEKQALERKIDRVTRQFEMLRRGDKREREKEFTELETAFADTVWALTRGDDEHPQKETPDLPGRG